MPITLSDELKKLGFGGNVIYLVPGCPTAGLVNEVKDKEIKYISKYDSCDDIGVCCFNSKKEFLFEQPFFSRVIDCFHETEEQEKFLNEHPEYKDECEYRRVTIIPGEDEYYLNPCPICLKFNNDWRPSWEKAGVEDELRCVIECVIDDYEKGYTLAEEIIYLDECFWYEVFRLDDEEGSETLFRSCDENECIAWRNQHISSYESLHIDMWTNLNGFPEIMERQIEGKTK